MRLEEYEKQISELCIVNVEQTWSSYIEPCYKVLLTNAELTPDIVEDHYVTWNDVLDMLKLEVEKRHALTGKSRLLAEWVYEIIDGTLNPAIEKSEAEMVNNIISLLKDKADIESKKSMLDEIEAAKAAAGNRNITPGAISFAKKELKS